MFLLIKGRLYYPRIHVHGTEVRVMNLGIEERVALVTGAGQGIGRQICLGGEPGQQTSQPQRISDTMCR